MVLCVISLAGGNLAVLSAARSGGGGGGTAGAALWQALGWMSRAARRGRVAYRVRGLEGLHVARRLMDGSVQVRKIDGNKEERDRERKRNKE